jgi:hypothetical protein
MTTKANRKIRRPEDQNSRTGFKVQGIPDGRVSGPAVKFAVL